ncbi:hypothetical protein RJT34_28732 [Clitoria ternatea]|uniref:Uncharacterized protein n=1 Tax=Clitoria ternatea TaxID=43366 RepID=A0AAN9F982_CLITE
MLLCLFLSREHPGCISAYECFGANAATLKEIRNRKVLSVLKASLQRTSSSITNGGESLSRELRVVPSGPDPLHHNGGNVPP